MRPDTTPVLALLLVGCTASTVSQDTAAPRDTEVDDGPESSWTVDEIEDQEVSDEWLFDTSRIHLVEIELSSDAKNDLNRDPWEYTEADSVTIDGMELESVGVRLRGKIGSFRELSGKPKWKLDFNRYEDGRRFYGLEALSINNMVVDCSYMREIIAAEVLAELGVPGSRAAYTFVEVNGDDYGLNLLMEVQDDRFLKRHYADPSGNLYDAKYWYDEDTGNYQLLDFAWGVDEVYQLEEGEDVGHEDIKAISNALSASYGQPHFYETMGELVDWPALHRSWAAEQLLGQNDGYVLNRNNTRLYFDPEDGKAEQIVWDFDYSFLHASDWSRSWTSPTGNLAYWCRYDAECAADWKQAVADSIDTFEAMALDERFEELLEFTEEAIDDDRRGECSSYYIGLYQDSAEDFLDDRADEVRDNWGLD